MMHTHSGHSGITKIRRDNDVLNFSDPSQGQPPVPFRQVCTSDPVRLGRYSIKSRSGVRMIIELIQIKYSEDGFR